MPDNKIEEAKKAEKELKENPNATTMEINTDEINNALVRAVQEREETIAQLKAEMNKKDENIKKLEEEISKHNKCCEQDKKPEKDIIEKYLTNKRDWLTLKIHRLDELQDCLPELVHMYNKELIAIYSSQLRQINMMLLELNEKEDY